MPATHYFNLQAYYRDNNKEDEQANNNKPTWTALCAYAHNRVCHGVHEAFRSIYLQAQKRRNDECTVYYECCCPETSVAVAVVSTPELRFWTSHTATAVYMNIAMAIGAQRVWVLYGTLFILLLQIVWVAFQWTLFIVQDGHLHAFVAWCRTWLYRAAVEGDKICNQQDGARMRVAGTVYYHIPRGYAICKNYVREKTKQINEKLVLREFNSDKYRMLRVSFQLDGFPNLDSFPQLDSGSNLARKFRQSMRGSSSKPSKYPSQ